MAWANLGATRRTTNLNEKSDNLIEIRDLMYSRGTRVIFKDLNLTIKRGEVTAFMGPSGTGKTTLLRLITRQLVPQQGAIFVNGVDIATLTQTELYAQRQRFGMLFQNGALLTDINVFENVAFPLREHTNLTNRLIRHVVLTKLHAVGFVVMAKDEMEVTACSRIETLGV